MDNGGSQKSKKIKDIVKKSKNVLQYSVPYKPKTNAIESWFSQFKHYFVIENNAISYEELKIHIKKCIRKIPKQSYTNYMKYAYKTKDIGKIQDKPFTRRRLLKIY